MKWYVSVKKMGKTLALNGPVWRENFVINHKD